MTPIYAHKLHSALLDIKRQVEKQSPVLEIRELRTLFDELAKAVDEQDMGRQSKVVKKLIGEMVRWRVEKM